MTSAGRVATWARKRSLWLLPFGSTCCAAELTVAMGPRYHLARWGARVVASPRHADLLVVAGRLSLKQIPELLRTYEQMLAPKWVMAFGACAASGGAFDTYSVVQGVSDLVPVDIVVPGCPPRPEDMINGLRTLQKRIGEQR